MKLVLLVVIGVLCYNWFVTQLTKFIEAIANSI